MLDSRIVMDRDYFGGLEGKAKKNSQHRVLKVKAARNKRHEAKDIEIDL